MRCLLQQGGEFVIDFSEIQAGPFSTWSSIMYFHRISTVAAEAGGCQITWKSDRKMVVAADFR